MINNIEATYDGQVIYPNAPLQLEANTRVQIKIKPTKAHVIQKPIGATEHLLKPETPAHLSQSLDHYLFW